MSDRGSREERQKIRQMVLEQIPSDSELQEGELLQLIDENIRHHVRSSASHSSFRRSQTILCSPL